MYTMVDIWYSIIIELFELLSYIVFMCCFCQCKLKNKILPYIISVILVILILEWYILSNNPENFPPLCVLIELIVIYLCIKEILIKKISFYITVYICSFIIRTIFGIILSFILKKDFSFFSGKNIWHIIVILLSICFALLFAKIIRKHKKIITNLIKSLSIHYVCIVLLGLFCCALILTFVQIASISPVNYILSKLAIIAATFVCVLFIVGTIGFIIINNSRKYYQMQNKLNEKYLIIQQRYYRKILENDKEIRKYRHDLKAHMNCIRLLAEDKRYQELTNYISQVTNDVDQLLIRNIKSGNDIVDALINYMANEAKKDEVTITLDGIIPSEINVTGPDLCTIFTNTISNAIEALKFVEQKENSIIKISISNYKQSLIIVIQNSVDRPVDIELLGKTTSKSDKENHGFGIQNIIECVNKYKGDIKFINLDGYFRVEIILLEVF